MRTVLVNVHVNVHVGNCLNIKHARQTCMHPDAPNRPWYLKTILHMTVRPLLNGGSSIAPGQPFFDRDHLRPISVAVNANHLRPFCGCPTGWDLGLIWCIIYPRAPTISSGSVVSANPGTHPSTTFETEVLGSLGTVYIDVYRSMYFEREIPLAPTNGFWVYVSNLPGGRCLRGLPIWIFDARPLCLL